MNFRLVDDLILEREEGFLAQIKLESAMYPDLVQFNEHQLTLVRIRDNDGKRKH